MDVNQCIRELASFIVNAKMEFPLRVGIDGIDAAGKTFLADKIANQLNILDVPVIRASIDGFHHPQHIRYQKGSYSPEGYYDDSFNYDQLISNVLAPLDPQGNRVCRLTVFDFQSETEISGEEIKVSDSHILIFGSSS